MGITAGAEDVKYQAKYRELKKKVKEIESVSHYQSVFVDVSLSGSVCPVPFS